MFSLPKVIMYNVSAMECALNPVPSITPGFHLLWGGGGAPIFYVVYICNYKMIIVIASTRSFRNTWALI